MAGRPRMYDDPDLLQAEIDKYFKEGVKKKKVIIGKGESAQLVEIEVPTISGLCYYCGFESRQSFYAYEHNELFSYTVKRARLFIEQHYEEMLQQGNTIGAIFALKNFDWSDKSQLEHSGDLTINWHEERTYIKNSENKSQEY